MGQSKGPWGVAVANGQDDVLMWGTFGIDEFDDGFALGIFAELLLNRGKR